MLPTRPQRRHRQASSNVPPVALRLLARYVVQKMCQTLDGEAKDEEALKGRRRTTEEDE